MRLQQAEALKEAALFNFMTKEARERFRRVEMAHPENANKALMIILEAIQERKISQINDDLLKKVLKEIVEKKEYKIVRR
jgi:DNA-binding TFAR19-related protein (PDSD5 family)